MPSVKCLPHYLEAHQILVPPRIYEDTKVKGKAIPVTGCGGP
jgi:hypothetical protein